MLCVKLELPAPILPLYLRHRCNASYMLSKNSHLVSSKKSLDFELNLAATAFGVDVTFATGYLSEWFSGENWAKEYRIWLLSTQIVCQILHCTWLLKSALFTPSWLLANLADVRKGRRTQYAAWKNLGLIFTIGLTLVHISAKDNKHGCDYLFVSCCSNSHPPPNWRPYLRADCDRSTTLVTSSNLGSFFNTLDEDDN